MLVLHQQFCQLLRDVFDLVVEEGDHYANIADSGYDELALIAPKKITPNDKATDMSRSRPRSEAR